MRAVVASLLHQPDTDTEQLRRQLTILLRENAMRAGISADVLEAGVAAFGAHLDNLVSPYSQFEAHLRRLGETARGRQFLAAVLLMRAVQRVGL